jgi:hypothetical protein
MLSCVLPVEPLNRGGDLMTTSTGAETIGALPTNEWAFLSIVFSNKTQSPGASADGSVENQGSAAKARDAAAGLLVSHPADYYDQQDGAVSAGRINTAGVGEKSAGYSVSVYLNGVLDVKMDFSDPSVGNEHSAMFFKDVSFAGASSDSYVGVHHRLCEHPS